MQVKDIHKATQRETAAALGVNSRTLRGWHDSGCPRNGDLSYSIPDVIGWRVAVAEARADETGNGDSPELEKWRRARRELAELDLHERRRELVRADVVRGGAARAGAAFASALRGIGPRLAMRLAAMDDPNDIDEELTVEAERVIGDLNANMGRICAGGE